MTARRAHAHLHDELEGVRAAAPAALQAGTTALRQEVPAARGAREAAGVMKTAGLRAEIAGLQSEYARACGRIAELLEQNGRRLQAGTLALRYGVPATTAQW